MTNTWFRNIELDTWADFKSLIGPLVDNGTDLGSATDYWYRGQGDSRFKLESSLDRVHSNLSIPERIKLQESMREIFSSRAVSVSKELREKEEWSLAMLQHHGAPTRLLDWTTSPYVGAFFALTSPNQSPDASDLVAVWMLSIKAEHWGAKAGLTMLIPDLQGNRRAFQQHGHFTLNESLNPTVESYLQTYYSPAKTLPSRPALIKVEFPRSESSSGLRDLALMGISSESLFPEWEGLSRHSYFKAMDGQDLLD